MSEKNFPFNYDKLPMEKPEYVGPLSEDEKLEILNELRSITTKLASHGCHSVIAVDFCDKSDAPGCHVLSGPGHILRALLNYMLAIVAPHKDLPPIGMN